MRIGVFGVGWLDNKSRMNREVHVRFREQLKGALTRPAMESWNHSFKVEAIHGERFLTRSAAKYQTFDYIEVYYNRKRLHSKLGYVSPENFEAKKVA